MVVVFVVDWLIDALCFLTWVLLFSVFCVMFCCLGCQSSIHGEEKKVEYEDATGKTKTGGLVLKMLSGGVCVVTLTDHEYSPSTTTIHV
jgi:hypothetical protein